MTTNLLAGRRLLVVEDEYFIASEIVRTLEKSGAEVVGPVPTVSGALDLINETERLDGAVLDVNLRGEMAYPVADALLARGVPLVFATGYDKTSVPQRYAHIRRCEKPFEPRRIAQALFG